MIEPIWWAIVGAAAISFLWRFLGMHLSSNVSADAPFLQWVKLVAYATIAAILARMLLLPAGVLTQLDSSIRWGAFVLLFALIMLMRRFTLLCVGLIWGVCAMWFWLV